MRQKLTALLLSGVVLLVVCIPAAAEENEDVRIALVGKSAGNAFFEVAAVSFKEEAMRLGADVETLYPEAATAEAQIRILEKVIESHPDGICISVNDAAALEEVLHCVMENGIRVTSFDSAPGPDCREIFINQSPAPDVARVLLDAVFDIAGGEGEWAILSGSDTASNQNAWIEAMQTLMEEEKYVGLTLAGVVYGDDDPRICTDLTEKLLREHPHLKVICAPTTVGITSAAKFLQENGSRCLLTGLGLPSEMIGFTGDTEEFCCPCFFLWDMKELGRLAACATVSLIDGSFSGEEGDLLRMEDKEYTVLPASDGGSEIVLGPPVRITSDNIIEMADLYQ